METEQKQINKEGFDEETKQKIQTSLDEIDRKQQKMPGKTEYIRFVFDIFCDTQQPHEYVEIIAHVLPAVIPLITEVFRLAVKRNKLERVKIVFRNQKVVMQGNMSYDQVQDLVQHSFGLSGNDNRVL